MTNKETMKKVFEVLDEVIPLEYSVLQFRLMQYLKFLDCECSYCHDTGRILPVNGLNIDFCPRCAKPAPYAIIYDKGTIKVIEINENS